MKKKIIIFSSIGGAILIGLTILIICLCLPKGEKTYRSIKVFSVTNNVNVIRNKDTFNATKDMKLKNEDIVEVKDDSSVVLKLDSDKFVMAKENTTFRLLATGKEKNTKTRILVDKGGVIVEVKEKLQDSESFEIASSNSVMAIRGTRISFDVEVKDNKITTNISVLTGKTEVLLYKNEVLSSTELSENLKLSYSTEITDDISAEDISKLIDKVTPTVISDSTLEEVFNVIKEELTSEEIDKIVDAVNEFEREEKLNGVIKFKNNVSELEFNKNPKDKFIPDKEYDGLDYYYSTTIDGEYKLYNNETTLNVGSSYYFKAISKDAYRSDPFLVTIMKADLNLNIKLDQVYYTATDTPGNILVSIENDEFFKSSDSEILDEYGQPINYILCKFKSADDHYHYLELNYRNKLVTLERDWLLVLNQDGATSTLSEYNNFEIEFEYHINGEKYNVVNPEKMNYSFTKGIYANNLIVYYNANDNTYFLQMDKGSICPDDINELTGATEFYEMVLLSSDPEENPGYGNRREFYYNKQGEAMELYENGDIVDGEYKFVVVGLATVASGEPYAAYNYTDWLTINLNNIDTTKPIPEINVLDSGTFITYNNDGTVNMYIDLQFGYQDGDAELGDYLVRYNVKDSNRPDTYVRGNGRFLALENITPNNYVIKQVLAVDKEVDGVIYGLTSFDEAVDISAGVSGIFHNSLVDGDNYINKLSFGFADATDGTLTVIDSLGNSNEYSSQDADSDEYDSSINYVIVYIDCNKRYDVSIINSITDAETLEVASTLTDEQFSLLKEKMQEKHNIDVKGSNKGKLSYKIYFETS